MTGHEEYFAYLLRRSRAGLLYRKLWLYPRLCRHLSGRVLDVGCGIGDMLSYRADTVGVDINDATINYCRSRGLDVHAMEGGGLPFADESFDGVVLDNVLEHIAEPDILLREIRRVLVQGGRLIVGVPGSRGYASDADHKLFYDEAALITTLGNYNFHCTEVFAMPFRSKWLDRRMRQYCIYAVANAAYG